MKVSKNEVSFPDDCPPYCKSSSPTSPISDFCLSCPIFNCSGADPQDYRMPREEYPVELANAWVPMFDAMRMLWETMQEHPLIEDCISHNVEVRKETEEKKKSYEEAMLSVSM